MKLLKEIMYVLNKGEVAYSDLPPTLKYFVDIQLKEMGKLPTDLKEEDSDEPSPKDVKEALQDLQRVVRS